MAKRFSYSKKNKYKFTVPEKYAKYVNRKALAGSHAKKAPVSAAASAGAAKGGTSSNKITKAKSKKKVSFSGVAIRIVAAVIMVASIGVIVNKVLEYLKDDWFNESITTEFNVSSSQNELLSTRDTPLYPEYEGSEETRIEYPMVYDVDSLKQLSTAYPDFAFWVYIENTTINYPVVQAPDNDYYLRRNMDGETNLSGTLFLDYRNEKNLYSGNNIVYGHNMQNGTMFGTLKKLDNREYYYNHKMIYTYSATEVIAWEIFSVYETTTENNYIQTAFGIGDKYFEFLSKLKRDSIYDTGVEIHPDDVILTLSTCHKYDVKNGRFVVHAVKVGSAPLV